MIKTIEAILMDRTRDSVGWKESDDRKEFEKGAEIAISRSCKHFNELLSKISRDLQIQSGLACEYETDLKILSTIINKYGEKT